MYNDNGETTPIHLQQWHLSSFRNAPVPLIDAFVPIEKSRPPLENKMKTKGNNDPRLMRYWNILSGDGPPGKNLLD